MTNKPDWWPHNPYPKDIFPMEMDEVIEVVPDPHTLTALSGCMGRHFYDVALHDVWEVLPSAYERTIELEEVIKECHEFFACWPFRSGDAASDSTERIIEALFVKCAIALDEDVPRETYEKNQTK